MQLLFGYLLYTPKNPRQISEVHSSSVPALRVSLLLHVAQPVHDDLNVSGKMFNPLTGRTETINLIGAGADSHIWVKSLANEIGSCSPNDSNCW